MKIYYKFNPDYLQKVPLKYLASYLGITQRHLSRLRKRDILLDICPF
jgi:DNA-directed RNA polymerase specialized sigma subunit